MEIPWTSAEETQVILFYPFMDVSILSEHINRSPLAISFKLVKLGMEKNIKHVRGFNEKWLKRNHKPKPKQEVFSISKVTVFFK